jgi:hypothetical protein
MMKYKPPLNDVHWFYAALLLLLAVAVIVALLITGVL